jgi:hypothetical protein
MDPNNNNNRRPSRPSNNGFAGSSGNNSNLNVPPTVAGPSSGSHRAVSPSPSAFSRQPPTPDAVSDMASDYFNPVSTSQSAASGASAGSASRPAFYPFASNASGTTTSDRRGSYAESDRLPSIRIRRSHASSLRSRNAPTTEPFPAFDGDYTGGFQTVDPTTGRARSVSQPERNQLAQPDPVFARHSRHQPQIALPRLTEEGARPTMAELGIDDAPLSPSRSHAGIMNFPDPDEEAENPAPRKKLQRRTKVGRMLWPRRNQNEEQADQEARDGHGQPVRPSLVPHDPNGRTQDEYDEQLVDWLDIIDPEVQTLATLTNVQNSLFVPDLGNWVNRRPTYVLSDHPEAQTGHVPRRRRSDARRQTDASRLQQEAAQLTQLQREQQQRERQQREQQQAPPQYQPGLPTTAEEPIAPTMQRSSTITSRLTESHYAALPHGENLEGWTREEKSQLDDLVRHMLHSRRSRMKRRLKGFGQYVRRPLGFFVTLYAVLITLFGLAWVLFQIGWIYVGEKQLYVVHVIDSVLVALFAIMGDGLAPFRAIDTYHMWFIARYTRMMNNAKAGKRPRSRLQKPIPPEVAEELYEEGQMARNRRTTSRGPNDLDEQHANSDQTLHQNVDVEDQVLPEEEEPALLYLTPKQVKSYLHHQKKLARSHSFYKPRETFTHHSFPLAYLIAIVILLDCHSCLQIALGATTWGIDYRTRHMAITTVILCMSITCNITAGLLISRGDRKTRKKDVWELLNRQELTSDAIKKVQEQREKENTSPTTDKDDQKEDETAEKERERELENKHQESTKERKLAKAPSPSSN